ncbi:MAG: hypothetical protein HGGPFJEG_01489 [Ignavibacteria bacterium]|nr:hypothetical protein [Ignavibacteria bacterium]
MKRHFIFHQTLFFIYLSGFILLILILHFSTDNYAGFGKSDLLSQFWYYITVTGSPFGFILILIITAFVIFVKRKSTLSKKHVILFFSSVILLQILLTSGLLLIKNYYKKERPYQKFIFEKGLNEQDKTKFYSLPEDGKYDFLKSNVNRENFNDVNKQIFESWLNEKAYSFPSGHSETSFFAAIILSFVILKTASGRWKYISVVPVIWCILVSLSRVFAGFHYSIDVIAGAFTGLTFGLLLVSNKNFTKLIS